MARLHWPLHSALRDLGRNWEGIYENSSDVQKRVIGTNLLWLEQGSLGRKTGVGAVSLVSLVSLSVLEVWPSTLRIIFL